MRQRSEKFVRERKMLLFAPVVIVPLLALAFHGFGGGKGNPGSGDSAAVSKGINTKLPGPHFNSREKNVGKLDAYKKADLEAARMQERIKEDPYYSSPVPGAAPDSIRLLPIGRTGGGGYYRSDFPGVRSGSRTDSQANELLRKLDALKGVLNTGAVQSGRPGFLTPGYSPVESILKTNHGVGHPPDAVPEDPQLEKLSILLDKILRIQHPLEDRADTTSRLVNSEEFVVRIPQKDSDIKTLSEVNDRLPVDDLSGFEEITGSSGTDSLQRNLIAAVIDQDAVLVSGMSVALRLTQDVQVNGVAVPRNTVLSGKVSINGERFLVAVSSIRLGQTALPVALEVYDQDGLAGIRIPGAVGREVSKESADAAVSGLSVGTLDPSFGAQAANAGLQAAKTLVSRKVRVVRGEVPAGYKVFLKNVKGKF